MKGIDVVRLGVLIVMASLPAILVTSWNGAAAQRLATYEGDSDGSDVAVASAADRKYCNADLKKVLRRVLKSCGLLDSGSVRGCEPADAEAVATMKGSDFNALFEPMKKRGGIIQFDQDSAELDREAKKLVEQVFADQRGASYFFVVARASPEGAAEYNQKLSKKRAQAVMEHLTSTFDDPELKREVGLLWLGEEYAQLDNKFCDWRRSRSGECTSKKLNRSAFMAWIDCTL
ncbi:MAG: OmpA family protein [Bradymonadaceae bacterium]